MRDAWINLLTQLALATGVAAKIAGDIALMSQSEIGEAVEPIAERRAIVGDASQTESVFTACESGRADTSLTASRAVLPPVPWSTSGDSGTWQAELATRPPSSRTP